MKKKVIQIKTREEVKFSTLAKGEIHHFHMHVSGNAFGTPWKIPVIAAIGKKSGPTLGITAALHGNELNGIFTIHKLFNSIDPKTLCGNLIAVPVVNVPGFLNKKREFSDGKDLNRYMPGRAKGTSSEMYNHFFTEKIVRNFDYLLDLHTASFGRINSLYIRADLNNPVCKTLAYLQNPQIIVQKYDDEGTLRAWANAENIPCITIEIGNPHTRQHELVDDTLHGLLNTLRYYKMIPGVVKDYMETSVVCESSSWIYSYTGGIIEVFPALTERVQKDQLIARVHDVFGNLKQKIFADRDGIVIGKNIDPVCEAGSRILHLGNYKDKA
ncbi:MAG: succinylglutamate desuccinylase/aspartoacylase family protein [Bacteriovoracaceae bacterium]|nr:succinylglutamate desuccinylase/aspartoacylase family protein [Bacteriovoracaceae bacterium]